MCFTAISGCENPDSYGEICVHCNGCGRWDSPGPESNRMTIGEYLERKPLIVWTNRVKPLRGKALRKFLRRWANAGQLMGTISGCNLYVSRIAEDNGRAESS